MTLTSTAKAQVSPDPRPISSRPMTRSPEGDAAATGEPTATAADAEDSSSDDATARTARP